MSRVAVAPVVAAARAAGAVILQELQRDLHAVVKSDGSPVTDADKKADAMIKAHLRALTPDIPVASEENDAAEWQAVKGHTLRWIVDPLDGTRTALGYAAGHKDHDQFGVHIALVDGDVPVLGVAYFPAMADGKGVAYFTGDDGKAYKQVGDATPQRIQVSKPPFKAEGLRAAVHFHPERRPAEIAGRAYRAVAGVGGQRICLVAEGAADVADMNDIPETHRGGYAYKQWDVAASHAILNAAGGALVSVADKAPISYPADATTIPGAVAGGDDTLRLLGLGNVPPRHGKAR